MIKDLEKVHSNARAHAAGVCRQFLEDEGLIPLIPCYLKFNRTPLGDDVLVHLKSPDHISHYQGPDPDLGGNPPGDISLGECPDIRHTYKHVGSYKLLSTKYQHKGVFEFT